MLPLSVVLGLGGTLLLAVADKVPSLNVEPACRAAAKMGDSLSLDTTLRQCLADEKSARDQLEKEWTGLRQAATKATDNDAGRQCALLIPSRRGCALGSQTCGCTLASGPCP